MKFKNDNDYDEDVRILTFADKENDKLQVVVFPKSGSGYQVMIGINDDVLVGMTRKKAIKLANAILDELDSIEF